MSEVYLHQADARKHRLQKRFGHPSLHEPLFTPMLHKSVQHLLPTMFVPIPSLETESILADLHLDPSTATTAELAKATARSTAAPSLKTPPAGSPSTCSKRTTFNTTARRTCANATRTR